MFETGFRLRQREGSVKGTGTDSTITGTYSSVEMLLPVPALLPTLI